MNMQSGSRLVCTWGPKTRTNTLIFAEYILKLLTRVEKGFSRKPHFGFSKSHPYHIVDSQNPCRTPDNRQGSQQTQAECSPSNNNKTVEDSDRRMRWQRHLAYIANGLPHGRLVSVCLGLSRLLFLICHCCILLLSVILLNSQDTLTVSCCHVKE